MWFIVCTWAGVAFPVFWHCPHQVLLWNSYLKQFWSNLKVVTALKESINIFKNPRGGGPLLLGSSEFRNILIQSFWEKLPIHHLVALHLSEWCVHYDLSDYIWRVHNIHNVHTLYITCTLHYITWYNIYIFSSKWSWAPSNFSCSKLSMNWFCLTVRQFSKSPISPLCMNWEIFWCNTSSCTYWQSSCLFLLQQAQIPTALVLILIN